MSRRRYVFGPVPSRRLGRSLGVDLVPAKTCSHDCIYCQLKRTTNNTVERREWVPAEHVLEDIRAKLGSKPDYITFSGSGEPTLHSGLGRIIADVKAMTETPVAVLTNGSLLWMPEVRKDLSRADLVVPSLDAGDGEMFEKVNHPAASLSFDRHVEGLEAFRREYEGKYWLEVVLLKGMTAVPEEARKIARLAERIGPDRIHLNTVTRPPADPSALAAEPGLLESLLPLFGPKAELASPRKGAEGDGESGARPEDVLEMLGRRPCTVKDVAAGLGVSVKEAARLVLELFERGRLRKERVSGREYWRPVE